MDDSVIIKAARFAEQAHRSINQKRTDGSPYFLHPARVAGMTAAYYQSTPIMVALAYLHDTKEDVPSVTIQKIELEFGLDLARFLTYISKPKGMKWTREEVNAHYNGVLKTAPFEVKIVKLFDRLDNLSDMKGYKPEKKIRYAQETRELMKAVGDADRSLESQLLQLADWVEGSAKA